METAKFNFVKKEKPISVLPPEYGTIQKPVQLYAPYLNIYPTDMDTTTQKERSFIATSNPSIISLRKKVLADQIKKGI